MIAYDYCNIVGVRVWYIYDIFNDRIGISKHDSKFKCILIDLAMQTNEIEFYIPLFVLRQRNRGGFIFSLKFVCLCVQVCVCVWVCVSVRLLTKCRSNSYTDFDAVFDK